MANEIARGGNGQVRVRGESALGTGTGSWKCARVDGFPNIPPSTQKLIAAGVGGHRNPLTVDKPVAVDVFAADAFTLKTRVHRASAAGAAPMMASYFKAAGWKHSAGPTATATSTGSPTTTAIIVDDATGIVAGEACLVELAGVYYPTLAAAVVDDTNDTITPSIAMSSAQDGSTDVVEHMDTFTPVTDTGYQVPTDATLQLTWNTLGYYDDAVADLSFLATGCAVASLSSIEIPQVGEPITMDWGFHAGDITPQSDDIAADDFTDTSPFVVVNKDAQFAIAATNAGSGIGTLVTKNFSKLTYNPGISVVPMGGQGGINVNGLQAYLLVQAPPTLTIDCYFDGDTAMSRMFLDELHDDNTSLYTHFIQPTRSLAQPAFGIWMPNCHLMAGSEPTVELTGEMIHITATLVGDLANWGGSASDIDDQASASIVIATSGQCA